MTRSEDDHKMVEQRLSAALHTLAETQIPAAAEQAIVANNALSGKRLLSVAAAVLIIAAGGIGIAQLRSESSPTTGQPAATPAATAQPGSESAPVPQPNATDSTDETTVTPTLPSEQPADLKQIAILDPAAGFGPAKTPGEVDLWLGGDTADNQHFAIRAEQTEKPVVLAWAVLSDSEWTKTYFDQPTVELADGRVARRLIPTFVNVVNYAIETDDGVFSASITPEAEPELAQWFNDVSRTSTATITPPEGYEPLTDVTDSRLAIYGGDITVRTSKFDRPIEPANYAATRFPGFSLEPAGDQGALVASPGSDTDSRNGTVVWQPQPDLVVTASGSPEDLARIVDALILSDMASADLAVMDSVYDLNAIGEPDLTILDETSEGRFAYTQSTDLDGSVCSSFSHNEYGGGGGCQNDTTALPGLDCGSGWSAPDVASASVFALSDVEPDIEFTIDGRPLDPNIETGTTDGVSWVFAWVHETGRAIDEPPIETAVDQTTC